MVRQNQERMRQQIQQMPGITQRQREIIQQNLLLAMGQRR
jgi:hypothetical protein